MLVWERISHSGVKSIYYRRGHQVFLATNLKSPSFNFLHTTANIGNSPYAIQLDKQRNKEYLFCISELIINSLG